LCAVRIVRRIFWIVRLSRTAASEHSPSLYTKSAIMIVCIAQIKIKVTLLSPASPPIVSIWFEGHGLTKPRRGRHRGAALNAQASARVPGSVAGGQVIFMRVYISIPFVAPQIPIQKGGGGGGQA
jgi:hypothetical protein